jgi:hypothetical protein
VGEYRQECRPEWDGDLWETCWKSLFAKVLRIQRKGPGTPFDGVQQDLYPVPLLKTRLAVELRGFLPPSDVREACCLSNFETVEFTSNHSIYGIHTIVLCDPKYDRKLKHASGILVTATILSHQTGDRQWLRLW